MSTPGFPLLQKEVRQNALVYSLPLPFALGLCLFRLYSGTALPSWCLPLFSFAVPLALAIAYGLQAFDVEEDGRTRDFLLAKPLSPRRIAAEKFCIGLFVLLLWTLAFAWLGNPGLFVRPRPLPVSSWVWPMLLSSVSLAYAASFFCGLLVKGAKKILAAAFLSAAVLGWAFFAWSAWAALLLHAFPLAGHPALLGALLITGGLILCLCFLGLAINGAVWLLQQRPALRQDHPLIVLLLLTAVLSAAALTADLTVQPPIRASYFAGLELFGADRPFWATEGAWRPDGGVMALACSDGGLGLARPGHKPLRIYQRNKNSPPPTDLAWSPDGRKIAFSQSGWVRYIDLEAGEFYQVGRGGNPCWAADGGSFLFSREEAAPRRVKTESGTITLHQIDLFRTDVGSKRVTPQPGLTSPNPYWSWDSDTDTFYLLDPAGNLRILGPKHDTLLALPGFAQRLESCFWWRILPLPGHKGLYTLAALSLAKQGGRRAARIYRLTAAAPRLELLRVYKNVDDAAVLIVNPQSGDVLWGRQLYAAARSALVYGSLKETR